MNRFHFFPDYRKYFKLIFRFAKNRLFIVIFLSLLVAVSDGFGIAMLLPLLQQTEVSTDPDSSNVIVSLFENIGIYDSTLTQLLIIIFFIFLVKGLLRFISGVINSFIVKNLLKEIKTQIIENYKNLDYKFFLNKESGHFTNVTNLQVDRSIFFFVLFNRFNTHFIMGSMFILFAFLIDWKLSLISIFAGGIALLALRKLSSFTKKLSTSAASENGDLNKFLIQIIQSYKYLKATDGFSKLGMRAFDSIKKITNFEYKSRVAHAFSNAISEPFTILIMLSLIFVHSVQLGNPLAPLFVTLLLFYRSMNTLMLAQQAWQESMGYAGSFDLVTAEIDSTANHKERIGTTRLEQFENLVFDKVDFDFNESRILRNVSFQVNKKEVIGIVGPSGSGKTTMLDLCLLLITPTKGSISINGKDCEELELNSWRNQIGFVNQNSVIFNDSIKNNITLWDDNPSIEKLQNVIRQSHCSEFIDEKSEGLDSLVGENGIKLSGGQKQRISIARELYKEPNILIFDEATSALDSQSENYIQESIEDLKGEVAMIVVAHRFSTLLNANRILVLSEGKIEASGSFSYLYENNEWFKSTADIQGMGKFIKN
jgi:ABC-type multidrug transport system fused ATPase/permease subunit